MSEALKPNEYCCSECGGVFQMVSSDEEARDEQRKLFPGVPDEDCVIVCDECFKGIHERYKQSLQ